MIVVFIVNSVAVINIRGKLVKIRKTNTVFYIILSVALMSILSTAHARRGIEEMKDPVELFYTQPGKITNTQAKDLITDAISRTSRPGWKQRQGRENSVRAEAERGRLYAAVDIKFNNEGLTIHYVDSERMKFRERRDKKFIRDIYNKWVKSLAKQLNRSAKAKFNIQLVSRKKRKLMKGLAEGKKLVVIAVRALPDVRPVRNGPKWSSQIGESMADAFNDKFGEKHLFTVLEWNRDNLNLVKNAYKQGYNKIACDAHGADSVITAGAVVDSTEVDGTSASEEMSLSYYNCDTEKLIVKTVQADFKATDKFDLQSGSIFHMGKLLSEAGL